MIGALYSTSQAPSLHCDTWYPLRTPIPVLVIRDMVPNDITFIDSSPEHLINKLLFVRSFLRVVSKLSCTINSNVWVQQAYNLRRTYRRKLALFLSAHILVFVVIVYLLVF